MERATARRVVDSVMAGQRDAKGPAMAAGVVRDDDAVRLHRNFLFQLAFMVAMWVWATLLGVSFLLPHN